MLRRHFLSALAATAAAVPLNRAAVRLEALANTPGSRPLAVPSEDQLSWQDLELGMFVHFAPNTWQAVEQDNLSTPLAAIDPRRLDTDQWAATARDLGARYIVFVAKHSGGFCMWQTRTTGYSIGHTPWRGGRGDVLADLSASCRKFGLKLGVYVSPRDATFHAGIGGRCATPEAQQRYNAVYRQQLTEVLSRYGAMVEVWFDGSAVIPVGDILARYAPHAMIFQGPHATIRWTGNEDGYVPYPDWNAVSAADAKSGIATALTGDPDGSVWLPNEVDVSILRPDWFWSPKNQRRLLSLEALLDIYYRSVGRGAQLLLNLPPDTSGLLPDPTCARARQFGNTLRRRFARPLAAASGAQETLTLALPRACRVDTVVLEEDCSQGQRIRAYRLETRVNGQWQTLASGSSVGHKRIQPVSPVATEALRVIVTDAAETPRIRRLAAFDTATPPPANWNAPASAWADNAVGSWSGYRFRIDLSARVHAATQYRLRFVPLGGWAECAESGQSHIAAPSLLLDGVAQPGLMRPQPGKSDTLLLTLPAAGQTVIVQGRIPCAASGSILLQRL